MITRIFGSGNLADERRIAAELQMQVWQDVPFIPMGEYWQTTAYRKSLTGIIPGCFTVFYKIVLSDLATGAWLRLRRYRNHLRQAKVPGGKPYSNDRCICVVRPIRLERADLGDSVSSSRNQPLRAPHAIETTVRPFPPQTHRNRPWSARLSPTLSSASGVSRGYEVSLVVADVGHAGTMGGRSSVHRSRKQIVPPQLGYPFHIASSPRAGEIEAAP
jgi:hypothetical protein